MSAMEEVNTPNTNRAEVSPQTPEKNLVTKFSLFSRLSQKKQNSTIVITVTPSRKFIAKKPHVWNRAKKATKTSAVVMNSNHDVDWEATEKLNQIAPDSIPEHSPADEIGTPASEMGKPAKSRITRHTRTRVELAGQYNKLAVYAQPPEGQSEKIPTSLKRNFLTRLLQGSKTTKKRTHDSETAAVAKKKKYRNQNKPMGKRARDITKHVFSNKRILKALEEMDLSQADMNLVKKTFKKIAAEWTHAISYHLDGEAGQVPENLVYAFKQANSQMMVVERYINKLHKDKRAFKLTVTFEDITEEVCSNIIMRLEKDGDRIAQQFIIDPLTLDEPLEQAFQYLELHQGIDDGLVEFAEEMQEESEGVLTTPISRK
jgi:hypothetical protein